MDVRLTACREFFGRGESPARILTRTVPSSNEHKGLRGAVGAALPDDGYRFLAAVFTLAVAD